MPDSADDVRSTAPANPIAGAARMFDYWVLLYLRTWKGSVITSFASPLLYVLAMGVLLGGFIEADPSELEGATSYLDFVAPGLLAGAVLVVTVLVLVSSSAISRPASGR